MKPYYTYYPYPSWFWFDVKVYAEFTPKTGNLPSDLFSLLKGGEDRGASRRYSSEAEALADLEQAKEAANARVRDSGSQVD